MGVVGNLLAIAAGIGLAYAMYRLIKARIADGSIKSPFDK